MTSGRPKKIRPPLICDDCGGPCLPRCVFCGSCRDRRKLVVFEAAEARRRMPCAGGCGKQIRRSKSGYCQDCDPRDYYQRRCTGRMLKCGWCGEEFYRSRAHVERAVVGSYCSKRCGGLARRQADPTRCESCGVVFYRAPSQISPSNYCSMKCAGMGFEGRALRRSRQISKRVRLAVFDRDRWRCKIPGCGKRVSKKLRWPHPRCAVIDHIVPVSAGGSDDPANLQCAHNACNSKKRAGGSGEQLALIGGIEVASDGPDLVT
jgi:HNH endonuclease